jgi:hypothetical protein
MGMYRKDGCDKRKSFQKAKAYLEAREVILKAERHPVVWA